MVSQAGILQWVAISFSMGSSPPRDQTYLSGFGRRILYHGATRGTACCAVYEKSLLKGLEFQIYELNGMLVVRRGA